MFGENPSEEAFRGRCGVRRGLVIVWNLAVTISPTRRWYVLRVHRGPAHPSRKSRAGLASSRPHPDLRDSALRERTGRAGKAWGALVAPSDYYGEYPLAPPGALMALTSRLAVPSFGSGCTGVLAARHGGCRFAGRTTGLEGVPPPEAGVVALRRPDA